VLFSINHYLWGLHDSKRVLIFAFLKVKSKNVKRLLQDIMRIFLPVLFLTYLVAITSFSHTHMVNGVTIVHSHPYNKHAAHNHTSVEFHLIHSLSLFDSDYAGGLCFLSHFIPILLFVLLGDSFCFRLNSPNHGITSLRAPPAVF